MQDASGRADIIRTMRPTRMLPPIALTVWALLATPATSAPKAENSPRTWFLTNELEQHSSGSNTTFGPGMAMKEGAGNGNFPTGVLLTADAGAFRSRIWSATPPAGGPSFGTRSWTIDFGGASAITDLHFIVGSWDHSTGSFNPAPGTPASVGPLRRATFTPTEPFSVAQGRDLGLRVWIPDDADTPSVIAVWDPDGGNSPSTLTLD